MKSLVVAVLVLALAGAALLQTQGEVSGAEDLLEVLFGLDGRAARRVERVWLLTSVVLSLLPLGRFAWVQGQARHRSRAGSGGFGLEVALCRVAAFACVAVSFWHLASVVAPGAPLFLTPGTYTTLAVGLVVFFSHQQSGGTGHSGWGHLLLLVFAIELVYFSSCLLWPGRFVANLYSGWLTVLDGRLWMAVLMLASMAAVQAIIIRLCSTRDWLRVGQLAATGLFAAGLFIIVWLFSRIEADAIWKISKFVPLLTVWCIGFACIWIAVQSSLGSSGISTDRAAGPEVL